MKKTPVSLVKERFESKEKLVAAVQKLATADLWLDRVSSAKGLGRVSNAKLVRLHDNLTDAKKRFGSRDKLVSSIVELKKRNKDKGFASKLAAYPLPLSRASAPKRAPRPSRRKPPRPRSPRPPRRRLPKPRPPKKPPPKRERRSATFALPRFVRVALKNR